MENVSRAHAGARAVYPVVAVVGASGAGKSTFIAQMTTGALPEDIRSGLPGGIEGWPVFEANDCLKENVDPADIHENSGAAAGLIVHYDIALIHRHGLRRYEDDPAAAFFRRPTTLTIVCIRPDPVALRAQFNIRQERHMRTKRWTSVLWRQYVRHPIRRALARIKGRKFYGTDDLYRDAALIRDCYAAWDRFVERITDEKPDTRIVDVEPYRDEAGNPTFRMTVKP